MYRWTIAIATFLAAMILTESGGWAQSTAYPGATTGGARSGRPRRKLRRNSSPALSPALNLLPGTSTTFEGQFLMRQLPQEQAIKAADQLGKSIDRLQGNIAQQGAEIRTGLGKTGHSVRFMDYGGYYQMGQGGSSRSRGQ